VPNYTFYMTAKVLAVYYKRHDLKLETSPVGGCTGTLFSLVGGCTDTLSSPVGRCTDTLSSLPGGCTGTLSSLVGGCTGTLSSLLDGCTGTLSSLVGGCTGTLSILVGGCTRSGGYLHRCDRWGVYIYTDSVAGCTNNLCMHIQCLPWWTLVYSSQAGVVRLTI
jgi:hypothetical protein